MAVVYVNGTFGLEYCSPGTSCAAYSVCNRGCTSNGWWCAYPHFQECANHACNAKTGLPKAHGGCHSSWIGFQQCNAQNVYLEASLQDCGPSRSSATAVACKNGTKAQVVACANPALFTSVCGGCNPTVVGIGYTKFSVLT